MPELPEVESVRRFLVEELTGRRFGRVRGDPVQLRRPLRPDRLQRALSGATLVGARRRGKFLLIDTGGGTLLVHLGMSGQLRLAPVAEPLAKHTHLRIELDDGRELRYVDPRRFGLVSWIEPGREGEDPSLARLGVEPLEVDLEAVLPSLFRARRAPVKALLLDQRLVAGVGNIYADESLWRASIRPTRPAGSISVLRLERLGAAVRTVLLDAIQEGGTTFRDFVDPSGEQGEYATRLVVYARVGDPCPRCGAGLRSGRVAGRGTTWCGRCQR